MSRSRARHGRAVLMLAIAILPWVALSRIGEWRPPPDPNASKAFDAIESFRSRAVVSPERLTFASPGKRADGTRQVWSAPLAGLGMSVAPPVAWETFPASSLAPIEPIALCLACRGPPQPAP